MKAVVSSRRQGRTTRLSMFLIMLMAVSLIAGIAGCGATGEPSLTFPDPNLEAAIREALSKPSGAIYASDLAGLAGLSAHERGIEELSGLQYCVNLTGLDLNYNEISNISRLANLTNLTDVRLGENQISNVSPLANLTSLTYLYLDDNRISDIAPLANLTSLTYLRLDENQVSNISALVDNEGLSEGDEVYLTGNPLSSDSVDIYIPQLEQRGVIVSH